MISYSKKDLIKVLTEVEKMEKIFEESLKSITEMIEFAKKYKLEFFTEKKEFSFKINNLYIELCVSCYSFREYYSWYASEIELIKQLLEKIKNLEYKEKIKLLQCLLKKIILKVKPI